VLVRDQPWIRNERDGMSMLRCINCGCSIDTKQKFCSNCGCAVGTNKTIENADRGDEAEHRQLTIIFSDIVGSVPLTEMLGAEGFREMLLQYRERAAQIFKRYDGHVARYIGDGTIVYFGYPTAHENDAQRAVHASLELLVLVEELSRIYRRSWNVDFQLRIAVHTGKVVAGDIRSESASESMAIVGNAANIAARIQQFGEPGTVVISRDTYRLVERVFRCSELGIQTLKGVSRPVQLYRVEGRARKGVRARPFDRTNSIIGRDTELHTLRTAWHNAVAGRGQVIVVQGEAGVGKSRLIAELAGTIDRRKSVRVILHCSTIFQNTAFSPWVEFLRASLGLETSHTPEEEIRRLEVIAAARELEAITFVPVFARLLSIELPDGRYPRLQSSPQEQKDWILKGMCEWLLKEASRRPLLLVVEDLHWADPSTIELLSLLQPRVTNSKILMILSSRKQLDQELNAVPDEIFLTGLPSASGSLGMNICKLCWVHWLCCPRLRFAVPRINRSHVWEVSFAIPRASPC
jgi:class 3 adenylate cyclase